MDKINIHRINDYIMSNVDMTPAERTVAYFTIHRARKYTGLFFWGAEKAAAKLGLSRKTVNNAWKKMAQWGWMTDTGQRNGRAKRWVIDTQQLWNDSQVLSKNFASDEQPVSTNSLKEFAQSKSLNEFTQERGEFSETENTPHVTTIEEVRTHASHGSKTSSL